MATKLLLLVIAVIISVQGSDGQGCDASSLQVQTTNTNKASPAGDPVFEVDVKNLCPCSVKNVRIDSNGFDTTLEVDPALFRADGGAGVFLLNDGGPIASMGTVSFQYGWDHAFQMSPKGLEEDQC